MVVASGATLEVVEVAIVVVLVFLVAVGCYGCLWVVVDGGSGLGWVFMGCGWRWQWVVEVDGGYELWFIIFILLVFLYYFNVVCGKIGVSMLGVL